MGRGCKAAIWGGIMGGVTWGVQNFFLGTINNPYDTLDYRKRRFLNFGENELRAARNNEIRSFTEKVESMGGKVVFAELPPGKAGGFNWATGEIVLPMDSDIALVTLQHEFLHYQQWTQIGQEAYVALGESAREIYVYKQLMGFQGRWTDDELREIIRYGEKFR